MTHGFTIDEKGRLVYLTNADDKSQAVSEPDAATIKAHRDEYDEFIERTARAGAAAESLPELIRADVAAMRSSGLSRLQAARRTQEDRELGEALKAEKATPKPAKKVKARRTGKGAKKRSR